MTPAQQKTVAIAAGAALVGASVLKHSRLARLAVAGGLAATLYTKLSDREVEWHEVDRPAGD
jgi:hypothetical protein